MADETVFTMVEYGDPCACCVTDAGEKDSEGNDYGCSERKTVFTRREEEVLKRILANRAYAERVKGKIREIIARYADGSSPPGQTHARELEMAHGELDALRRERAELEKERQDAADERMRLLGHL